jgi:hypothetical protein
MEKIHSKLVHDQLITGVNDKEAIFKQYSYNEETIAREIDEFIMSNLKEIQIKLPITDCIGYKVGSSKKFASLTLKNKHSLIVHVGHKSQELGIRLQEEIDEVLGKRFPRTKTDDSRYPHQAYMKLEWVQDIDQIKDFITRAYEGR